VKHFSPARYSHLNVVGKGRVGKPIELGEDAPLSFVFLLPFVRADFVEMHARCAFDVFHENRA
jgi:hypothetical protein